MNKKGGSGIVIFIVLIVIALVISIYAVFSSISAKDSVNSLRMEINSMPIVTLDDLSKCRSFENQEDGTFNCNQICQEQGMICIKADVAFFSGTINRWIVDTGLECGSGFSGLKNEPTEGNHKLQCLCCE